MSRGERASGQRDAEEDLTADLGNNLGSTTQEKLNDT